MAQYAEPSKTMFEYVKNEDGTYSITDIICGTVDHLIIPEGVVTIDRNTMSGNPPDAKKVTLPNTLKSIGPAVFCCFKLLKSISIPDSVEFIGDSAFQGCDELESVKLPDSKLKIDFVAFSYCPKLTRITIPFDCYFVGFETFRDCPNLQLVEFKNPYGWKKLGFDNQTYTHKKVLFSGVSSDTLGNARYAKTFLTNKKTFGLTKE